MNVFAKFCEIPSMILEVIKETKRFGRTDNVKTVYPPTNTVCRGIIMTVEEKENQFWTPVVHSTMRAPASIRFAGTYFYSVSVKPETSD